MEPLKGILYKTFLRVPYIKHPIELFCILIMLDLIQVNTGNNVNGRLPLLCLAKYDDENTCGSEKLF